MEFFHLRAGEEFIRLGQVLKAAGFVENGGQAKEVIQDGFVSVNGEVETRRGRKLYPNDVVSYEENELTVKQYRVNPNIEKNVKSV